MDRVPVGAGRLTSVDRRVPLCLLGPGRVGRSLLELVAASRDVVSARARVRLSVVAVADSEGLVAAHGDEIGDGDIATIVAHKSAGRALSDASQLGLDDARLVDALGTEVGSSLDAAPILVDASASNTSASLLDARSAGWRLAMANKLPLTGPWHVFESITRGGRGARWETTVASALPVASVLQRVMDQGDEFRWITGTLSGTLGHLTQSLADGVRLSEAVHRAVEQGLTEPDPRADLSGVDVARKALILARMAGMDLELADVAIEPFAPYEWRDLDVRSFLEQLVELDDATGQRFDEAIAQGAELRYAATIGGGGARTGWISVDPSSSLGCANASDSTVVIETSRFRQRPLVVSGRGSGPETTAAGLLADVIDLARS